MRYRNVSTVGLVLVATWMLSALSSAPASAEILRNCEKTEEGGDIAICQGSPGEGKEYEGILTFTNSGVSKLKTNVGTIECKKAKGETTIEDSGKSSKGTLELSECSLAEAPGCTVEPAVMKFKDTLSLPTERAHDTLEEEGAALAEFTIVGAGCALKGFRLTLTGSQECAFDKSDPEAETAKATHKLICKTSGSKLKVGGSTAEFESTADVKLAGGGEFWIAKS